MDVKSKAIPLPTLLEQSSENWYVTVRKLHSWASEPAVSAGIPHIGLVTIPDERVILKQKKTIGYITSQDVLNLILEAIIEPDPSSHLEPHRPQTITFDDGKLAEELSNVLADMAIQVIYQPAISNAVEEFGEIEEISNVIMDGIPSLLSIPGLTSVDVEHLFSSAAEYYRNRPWTLLSDSQPLAIYLTSQDQMGYFQLMGKAGLQFGLILYRDFRSLIRSYKSGENPFDQIDQGGIHSLTFETADGLPKEDLEAIEIHGWEIAGANAFPLPCIYTMNTIERPSREELLYFNAAMQAISHIVHHLTSDKKGDYLPVEKTFNIKSPDGDMNVIVRYPAGEFPSKVTK